MQTKQALATVGSLIGGMFMMALVIALIASMNQPAQAEPYTPTDGDVDIAMEDGYYAGLEDAAMCYPIDVVNAPDAKVDRLIMLGFWGDPSDNKEALYAPDCTHGDVINAMGEAGELPSTH